MKVQLTTTLNKIKRWDPCQSGLDKLLNHLGKDYPGTKSINILTILESNLLSEFFWVWRVLPKSKRLVCNRILADIVESVEHIYEQVYLDSIVIKNVVKALRSDRNLKKARSAADAASRAAAYAPHAAHAAAYASTYASQTAAYTGNAAHTTASNAASHAAACAAHASRAAACAAHASRAAVYAVNAANASNAASHAAVYAAYHAAACAAYASSDETYADIYTIAEKKQKEIIKKYLK